MKLLILLAVIVHLASLTPLKRHSIPRRYFPEENDPYRIKTLYYKDKNGNLIVEDLTIPPPKQDVFPENITMYLYTQTTSGSGFSFLISNFQALENSTYDPTKVNYFIVHGWQNDYASDVNVFITKAVLQKHKVNVFVVDWSTIAAQFYTSSKAAVPYIGQYLGEFITKLKIKYRLSAKMFKLVGHSLGAHVTGNAGAHINGQVDYIVGLDPAGPLYTISNTDNRLDESDAKFVHVIHTSDSVLGFGSALGNADYYPNNGRSQPGCGWDVVGICAHSRAYFYFAESIYNPKFTAKLCPSYEDFQELLCDHDQDSYLGTFNIDKSAWGDYYLDTNEEAPFAMG